MVLPPDWRGMNPRELNGALNAQIRNAHGDQERLEALLQRLASAARTSPGSTEMARLRRAVFLDLDDRPHAPQGRTPYPAPPQHAVIHTQFQQVINDARKLLDYAVNWEKSAGSARPAAWVTPIQQRLEEVKGRFGDASRKFRRWDGTGSCNCSLCEAINKSHDEAEGVISYCEAVLDGSIYSNPNLYAALVNRIHVDVVGGDTITPLRAAVPLPLVPRPPPAPPAPITYVGGLPYTLHQDPPPPKPEPNFAKLMDHVGLESARRRLNYDPKLPCNHRHYDDDCQSCRKAFNRGQQNAHDYGSPEGGPALRHRDRSRSRSRDRRYQASQANEVLRDYDRVTLRLQDAQEKEQELLLRELTAARKLANLLREVPTFRNCAARRTMHGLVDSIRVAARKQATLILSLKDEKERLRREIRYLSSSI